MKFYFLIDICLFILVFVGCKINSTGKDQNKEVEVITPVAVARPDTGIIQDEIVLNAISIYLLKTDIKANINGYITRSFVQVGDRVSRGEILFTLETKEGRSLGNIINRLDSSFKFSGINTVKSQAAGYVTMLNHQAGDYVQDGEVLATVANKNSFSFVLNLPYEYHALLKANKSVNLELPDGTTLKGYFAGVMPTVDSISQTQRVVIKIPGIPDIPENLIGKVRLTKSVSKKISLPRSAVLTDEGQQIFWVMQLMNDSLAVKVVVKKGIENDERVEILSPDFSLQDSFVLQGGYGLADTAKVRVVQ